MFSKHPNDVQILKKLGIIERSKFSSESDDGRGLRKQLRQQAEMMDQEESSDEETVFDRATLLSSSSRHKGIVGEDFLAQPRSGRPQMLSHMSFLKLRSFLLLLAFFNVGLWLAIVGPTLLDLQTRALSNLTSATGLVSLNAFGAIVGIFIGGVVFEYVNAFCALILTLSSGGFISIAIPWIKEFSGSAVMFVLQGVCLGLTERGAFSLFSSYFARKHSLLYAFYIFIACGGIVSCLVTTPFVFDRVNFSLLQQYGLQHSSATHDDASIFSSNYSTFAQSQSASSPHLTQQMLRHSSFSSSRKREAVISVNVVETELTRNNRTIETSSNSSAMIINGFTTSNRSEIVTGTAELLVSNLVPTNNNGSLDNNTQQNLDAFISTTTTIVATPPLPKKPAIASSITGHELTRTEQKQQILARIHAEAAEPKPSTTTTAVSSTTSSSPLSTTEWLSALANTSSLFFQQNRSSNGSNSTDGGISNSDLQNVLSTLAFSTGDDFSSTSPTTTTTSPSTTSASSSQTPATETTPSSTLTTTTTKALESTTVVVPPTFSQLVPSTKVATSPSSVATTSSDLLLSTVIVNTSISSATSAPHLSTATNVENAIWFSESQFAYLAIGLISLVTALAHLLLGVLSPCESIRVPSLHSTKNGMASSFRFSKAGGTGEDSDEGFTITSGSIQQRQQNEHAKSGFGAGSVLRGRLHFYAVAVAFLCLILVCGLHSAVYCLLTVYYVLARKSSQAAGIHLTVAYWAFVALGTFLALVLQRRVAVRSMFTLQYSVAVLSSAVLLAFSNGGSLPVGDIVGGDPQHSWLLLFASVAAYGCSLGSVFPVTYLWLDQKLQLRGVLCSVILASSHVGRLILPLATASGMQTYDPRSLVVCMAVGSVLAALLCVLLYKLVHQPAQLKFSAAFQHQNGGSTSVRFDAGFVAKNKRRNRSHRRNEFAATSSELGLGEARQFLYSDEKKDAATTQRLVSDDFLVESEQEYEDYEGENNYSAQRINVGDIKNSKKNNADLQFRQNSNNKVDDGAFAKYFSYSRNA